MNQIQRRGKRLARYSIDNDCGNDEKDMIRNNERKTGKLQMKVNLKSCGRGRVDIRRDIQSLHFHLKL